MFNGSYVVYSFHFVFHLFVKEIQEIKSDGVIILCSGGESAVEVKWFKDNNNKEEEIKGHSNLTYEVKADQGIVKGFYRCEYEKTDSNAKIKYVFFLRVQGEETHFSSSQRHCFYPECAL